MCNFWSVWYVDLKPDIQEMREHEMKDMFNVVIHRYSLTKITKTKDYALFVFD